MVPEATIVEAGARLARAAGPSAEVILFGSHARGDAGPNSDLDFLVIEPVVADELGEAVRLRRALRGLKVPADVIVMSRARVDARVNVRGTLVHAALREGRVLSSDV